MASNPWDNDPIVGRVDQPAPAPVRQSSPPPFIPGTPKPPPQPTPQTPIQAQGDVLDNQYKSMQIQKMQDEQAAEAEKQRLMETGIADSIYQMKSVVDAAKRAKALSNEWFATGLGSRAASQFSGTSAADVNALLNTIGANTAFDRLQKMRNDSPTGGALGQVTEKELQLLRDSITSLEQSQSDVQFQQSMDKVIENYQRVIDRLEGKPVADPTGQEDIDEGSIAGSITYEGPNEPPPPPPEVVNEAARLDQTMGQAGAWDLTKQGFMFGLGDETTGIGTAIGRALRGDFDLAGNYVLGRDAQRLRLEQAGDRSGALGTVAEIGGGIASGGSALMGGSVMRGSVAGGAVGGFGYGEGTQGSLGGAAMGAGLGAGAVAGFNALAPRVARALGGRSVSPEQTATIQAAQRLEAQGMPVPARAADIQPELAPQRAQARSSDLGRPIVQDAEQADIQAFEAAISKLGGDRGVNRPETMGDMVQGALAERRTASGKQATVLYDRAKKLAGDVEITPRAALAEIDNQIAELRTNGENSNRALITYLEDLKADLSRGGPVNTGILDAQGRPITRPPEGLSIETLRSQRTNARGQINERNLTKTDAERRVGIILDAAAADIKGALRGNERALNAFSTADDFYRTRARFIKQIERQIVGPDATNPISPSAAAARIEGWAKGDYKRFTRMMNELPPESRADIRSYVADSFGRDQAGNFSLSTFLKNTGTGKGALLSPKAMRLVFGDEGMRAINDLRTLAQAKVNAASATNYSNTGGVVNKGLSGLRSIVITMLGGGVGTTVGGPGGALVGGAMGAGANKFITQMGEKRMARLVTNPDFTKWLKNMPEARDPRAIDKYFEVLTKSASRSPVFAADVRAMQEALANAFAQSPTRAAAEGQNENNGGSVPPQ